MIRVFVTGVRLQLLQLMRSGFDISAMLVWPVILSSIAFYLLDAGQNPHLLFAAALGTAVMMMWAQVVVGALMRKLRVVEVDEFRGRYPHTMPTRLMVRMAGGRQYTVEIDVPLGHPRRPMPDVDIVHKVRRLSAGRLKESRLERFVEAVWKLETVKDVGTLMPWLKL